MLPTLQRKPWNNKTLKLNFQHLPSHHQDQTPKSGQPVPSQGTKRAGSRKLTHILHKDGSQPPEVWSPLHGANIVEKCIEYFDFELEFPASLNNDFPLNDQWHQCPGPSERATLQIKLVKTRKRKKKLEYLWSTIPQMLKLFSAWKIIYEFEKSSD